MSDTTLTLRTAPNPPSALTDGLTMVVRCVRMTYRDMDALLMAVMLPVMMMILFVYLFGGAVQTGGDYVTYVAPAVLLLCTAWGAAQTGVSVGNDMNSGIIDRFRSMGVGGVALLTGHVAASVFKNLVSTVIVLSVALLIGFRPSAGLGGWVAAMGILLLFILAISWLSAVFGLLTQSSDMASNFAFFMMFVPYISSGFVPINTLPTWLQGIARNQPATPIIESLRGFLLDRSVDDNAWKAIIWCAGILIASMVAAAILFRRRAD